MEFLAFIGGIVVLYVLWIIFNGFMISSDVKATIKPLIIIKFQNKSKEQALKEIVQHNLKYELNDNGTLFFKVNDVKHFTFIYDNTGMYVKAIGDYGTKYDGIELNLERWANQSEQIIRANRYYGNNKDAILFMAKLPFYGIYDY